MHQRALCQLAIRCWLSNRVDGFDGCLRPFCADWIVFDAAAAEDKLWSRVAGQPTLVALNAAARSVLRDGVPQRTSSCPLAPLFQPFVFDTLRANIPRGIAGATLATEADVDEMMTLWTAFRRDGTLPGLSDPHLSAGLVRLVAFVNARMLAARQVRMPTTWTSEDPGPKGLERTMAYCSACRAFQSPAVEQPADPDESLRSCSFSVKESALHFPTMRVFCIQNRNPRPVRRRPAKAAVLAALELVTHVESPSIVTGPPEQHGVCAKINMHGCMIELWGRLYALCWRCGAMALLTSAKLAGTGVDCGSCTANANREARKQAALECIRCGMRVRKEKMILRVLGAPPPRAAIDEVKLCKKCMPAVHRGLRARELHAANIIVWEVLQQML